MRRDVVVGATAALGITAGIVAFARYAVEGGRRDQAIGRIESIADHHPNLKGLAEDAPDIVDAMHGDGTSYSAIERQVTAMLATGSERDQEVAALALKYIALRRRETLGR